MIQLIEARSEGTTRRLERPRSRAEIKPGWKPTLEGKYESGGPERDTSSSFRAMPTRRVWRDARLHGGVVKP
jgi:hypothetical protein